MQPLGRRRKELGRGEAGLTLVEVLVAAVVVGALGAISLATFRGEGSKGTDAEAKSVAVLATRVIESCGAEHGGSYVQCSKEALLAIEPSLADAGDRLSVAGGSDTFEIGVASKRDPSVSFKVARASDGTTSRTCTTTEDKGGCRVPTVGTW